MTAQELANKANTLHDVDIDDPLFIKEATNDFQDDLANKTRLLVDLSLTVTADTWTDLPTNFIGVETVELNSEEYYDYEIKDTIPRKIRFPEAGTYLLTYSRTPNKITDINTSQVDAHPYLIGLGDLFLAYKYKLKDNEKYPERGMLLKQEYEQERDKRVLELRTNKIRSVRAIY